MKFASAKSLNEDARLRAAYKKAAALGAAAKAKKRDALVKKFCEGLKALVLAKRERINLITASELRETGKVKGAWAARCDNIISSVTGAKAIKMCDETRMTCRTWTKAIATIEARCADARAGRGGGAGLGLCVRAGMERGEETQRIQAHPTN